MGQAKAWLPVGDELLLQRMIRIVGRVVQPVVAAARPGQLLPPLAEDIRFAFDVIEDGGPLAGLAGGLDVLAGSCIAALVVSCDLPLLKPAFIERLIDLLGDHPAVLPKHEGVLHPLAGVYRLETREVLAEQLLEDDLRVREFARRCGAHVVSADDLRAVDPQLESLVNVNDPDTYERIRRTLESQGT
jgi:molybdopterin-guanine dinucleotide biosynthesis protein A